MIDKKEIYKWWTIFKNGKDLVEVRILGKKTYSGYYKDIDKLISDIERYDEDLDEQIYYTLNSIDDSCYGRAQCNKLIMNPKNTTTDSDIIGRNFVLIDLDPKRKTGVNASDVELEYAHQKALEIYRFLLSNGFNEPIVCKSGNGYHINVPCKIAVNTETDELIKRFLSALSMLFSDDYVEVDEKVFNRARISKLYGTTAKKGANIPERPHRMSCILKYPNEIKPNDIEYFRKIADLYPVPDEEYKRERYYSGDKFNLDEFLNKHNIAVKKIENVAGGKKYILEHCCFNEAHKGKDAVIFQSDAGALSYVCLHNSCNHYHWKDFRLKYEPDAYSRKDSQQLCRDFRKPAYKSFEPIVETKEKGEKWIKLSTVEKYKVDSANFIPSGIKQLDDLIIGFKRKHVSVWSGYRGCGKSTILNQLILNAANRGYKSALWTGELDNSEVKTWIYLQAAGKQWNKPSQFNKFYYTPDNISKKIDSWIDNYFFLFNNEYGDNYKQIEYEIRELKKKDDIDVVILDNLMCLDVDDIDGDKYDKQKQLMKMLTKLAKDLNIHVHLVAHPNKSGTFLRPNNISGSGHIPDLAQNVFISHKIGQDFTNDSKEFLTPITRNQIIDSCCNIVIEICKCREKGSATDKFIKLWFEDESNRLKNEISEHICYGWEDPVPAPTMYPEESSFNGYQRESTERILFGEPSEDCPF